MRIQILSMLCLLILSLPSSAVILEYGAKLNQADWFVLSSSIKCSLWQDIPLYGKAEFIKQYSDSSVQFKLHANRLADQSSKVILSSQPSKWDHTSLIRPLGTLRATKSSTPIIVEQILAMRIIAELEEGMIPTLHFLDWFEGRDHITVAISPINFREKLPKFLACFSKLDARPKPKPNPKPIPKPIKIEPLLSAAEMAALDTIYFAANSASLDKKGKQKLKVFVAKLKKDTLSKHIIVSGYSDDVGNKLQSITVSKKRAEAVQHFLQKQGLPERIIFTRYFGRDHAVASNQSKSGRAKNRRVHLDIISKNLQQAR